VPRKSLASHHLSNSSCTLSLMVDCESHRAIEDHVVLVLPDGPEHQNDGSPHVSPMGCRARPGSPPLLQVGVLLSEPLQLAPIPKGPSPQLPRYNAAKQQVLQGLWFPDHRGGRPKGQGRQQR
jgi:hypothetical protein